ncbi:hypothetical protein AN639_09470 [Candidatus Epulonipiscium fishelsonii]|uniref:Uncharacterized protein n=1 Tax=Candidatus Epulonipiscium fishelsonii TaxID=77094 RepID=A0ACC8XEL6_9FIRM|nr:hypothetical protein AN639_09470 [Epulopiscium sp. SCG-B05WGA-EpuloA1]ONI41416.1 hypothetical protein AN396_03600 [Epulopiscium sp. SCG-B11WGA-EpuloA1]
MHNIFEGYDPYEEFNIVKDLLEMELYDKDNLLVYTIKTSNKKPEPMCGNCLELYSKILKEVKPK